MTSQGTNRVHQLIADPSVQAELWEVIRRTHRSAPDIIEEDELFQVVVTQALSASHQFQGDSPPKLMAWVNRIAEHCLIDRLRSIQQRTRHRSLEGLRISDSSQPTPLEVAIRSDLMRLCLQLLDPMEAAILQARIAGLTFAQIAQLVDRSPATLRVIYHRLLAKLREMLAPPPEENNSEAISEQTLQEARGCSFISPW